MKAIGYAVSYVPATNRFVGYVLARGGWVIATTRRYRGRALATNAADRLCRRHS